MKLSAGMWIVVLDGARGMVLVNEGTALEPRLALHRRFAQSNPPAHEQGPDRPGRLNDSSGNTSAVEIPDPHQKGEDQFVADIVADLEKAAVAGTFDRIVIAAPPVALGVMRKAIGPEVKRRTVKEIPADYVKLPMHDIAAAVAKSLES